MRRKRETLLTREFSSINVSLHKIAEVVPEKLFDVIRLNREGKIKVTPGYDGLYGKPDFGEKEQVEVKLPEPEPDKKQKDLNEFFG